MRMIVPILIPLLLASCTVFGPQEEETATELDLVMTDGSVAVASGEKHLDTKARIVKEVENRMRAVLGESVRRFEDIRLRASEEQARFRAPFVIETVEIPIRCLYQKEEARYEARMQGLMERYLGEIDKVIGFVLEKVWEIAFDVVGTEDVGTGYDTRTGIRDVDDVINATIELVTFRAGRDEFLDDTEYLKRRRNGLSRVYKNDSKGTGRLCVYATESLYHYFSSREDGIAFAVVFRRAEDYGSPVVFRQAVRNRVTRGGSNIFDSGFQWDTTAGSDDGLLPTRSDVVDDRYVVSEVLLPRIDIEATGFDNLRNYTALRDYKTAVINSETGEIIDCVSWQIEWQISYNGVVSVDRGSPPHLDEKASEIVELLSEGDTGTLPSEG